MALDATDDVIAMAAAEKADMLITHHPLIFGSIKKINDIDTIGRRLLKLIQADISYYAGHTSFDIAKGGMADLAAEKLDIFSMAVPLEVTGEQDGTLVGIGKVGNTKEKLSVGELAERVKACFQIPAVTIYSADKNKPAEKIAVSPGSGKSMIRAAVKAGADVLITGDMGHHEGLDLMAEGVSLIDAGHYGLEHIFVDTVADLLDREGFGLEILKAPLFYPVSYTHLTLPTKA